MLPVEDIALWSCNEIAQKIQEQLPDGYVFDYHRAPWGHYAHIQDISGHILWSCDQIPELKQVLLGAYGWLALRSEQPRNPAWARRDETSRFVPKTGKLTLPGINTESDIPEDLDPDELRTLFDGSGRKT